MAALKRVLDPLIGLMFDAGVTVQDFNNLARERAVRLAAKRLAKESGRESRSRIAIITGLPRSEVARLLDAAEAVPALKYDHHPARRVLAAWHDNPRFLTAEGEPAELPLFGKKPSFEYLVEKFGAGIPIRAMLDELLQLDAVELVPDQMVRAKARVPVSTGLNSRSILAVGDRGRDLLETLAHNLRSQDQPLFEATALTENGDPEKAAFLRREITEQGANFINTVSTLLNRAYSKRGAREIAPAGASRFGVTVYYFQDESPKTKDVDGLESVSRRKNFRRSPRKSPKLSANHSRE